MGAVTAPPSPDRAQDGQGKGSLKTNTGDQFFTFPEKVKILLLIFLICIIGIIIHHFVVVSVK